MMKRPPTRLGAAQIRTTVISIVLLGFLAANGAAASERVTLRNGFDLVCDHREMVGDRVRLYTGPGSFVEVGAVEISGIEFMPLPALAFAPVGGEPIPQANAGLQPGSGQQSSSALQPTPAELHELMGKAGKQHNLDINLLASLVRAESGGNAHAVSRAGARGLMQLMPGTATELGVTDSFGAEQNINGGTAYLDGLLAKYHDNLALALAAYNAGPAAVDRYHGVPPYRETRTYVARVIREFNRLSTLRSSPANSPLNSTVTAQHHANASVGPGRSSQGPSSQRPDSQHPDSQSQRVQTFPEPLQAASSVEDVALPIAAAPAAGDLR